jgi:hypothetical protein
MFGISSNEQGATDSFSSNFYEEYKNNVKKSKTKSIGGRYVV